MIGSRLVSYWLTHSRYQPGNLPKMEIYRRQPKVEGWNQDTQTLDTFTDVRELQRQLRERGCNS